MTSVAHDIRVASHNVGGGECVAHDPVGMESNDALADVVGNAVSSSVLG